MNSDSHLELKASSLATGGCVSIATFSVKVSAQRCNQSHSCAPTHPRSLIQIVKPGRLRFVYSYVQPNDVANAMILFSFHSRNYDDQVSSEDEDQEQSADASKSGNNYFDASYDIKFPQPTDERKQWQEMDVKLKRSGFYSFMWRAVTIGSRFRAGSFINKRDLDTNSVNIKLQQDRQEPGFIKIKAIEVDGVAYASECTPCDAGSYASERGTAKCTPCPQVRRFI